MPQAMGEANEVPLAPPLTPAALKMRAMPPRAMMSGFTRPSCDGPIELNTVFRPWLSTAPTVSTSMASPGGVTFFQRSRPELPALHTSTTPFWASIDAVLDMSVRRPSRSTYLWLVVASSNSA